MYRVLAAIMSGVLLYAVGIELLALSSVVLDTLALFDRSLLRTHIDVAPGWRFSIAGSIGSFCAGLLSGFLTPALDRSRWRISAWLVVLVAIGFTVLRALHQEFLGALWIGIPGGLGVALGALFARTPSRTPADAQNLLPAHIIRTTIIITALWCLLFFSSSAVGHYTAESWGRMEPGIARHLGPDGAKRVPAMVDQLNRGADQALIAAWAGVVIGVLSLGLVIVIRRSTRPDTTFA